MRFELTKKYIDELKSAILVEDKKQVSKYINDLHPADIAEIFDEISIEEARFIYEILDNDKSADLIVELEEDILERIVSSLSAKEIATNFISNMESDDAADLIQTLDNDKKDEVLSHISNFEQASDIVDLLNYHEDTAGGLMATELIAVNENLTVTECINEIRKQAEELDEIFFVYVINNDEILQGTLPLKKLLIANGNTKINTICDKKVISVKTETNSEDVANIMEKYNIIALPVVDGIGRLKGRITIDDVVDVIKEEAEKDYQMISGISGDVESSDSVIQLTRARIPWLVIGLAGGIFGAMIIGLFEEQLSAIPRLAMFIPLIAAMGGNVGIQSSSIVVQGLANNTLGLDSTLQKLTKELSVALLNGIICSSLLFTISLFINDSINFTLTISSALMIVIIFASLFGTFVPLGLNKLKIDPALATGPFITTTNDVVGMLIYFSIGKFFLGY